MSIHCHYTKHHRLSKPIWQSIIQSAKLAIRVTLILIINNGPKTRSPQSHYSTFHQYS